MLTLLDAATLDTTAPSFSFTVNLRQHDWMLLSQICFGVGVSGSIFCIIRSAPPFGMTRNGNKASISLPSLCLNVADPDACILYILFSSKGYKYSLLRAGTSTWWKALS